MATDLSKREGGIGTWGRGGGGGGELPWTLPCQMYHPVFDHLAGDIAKLSL